MTKQKAKYRASVLNAFITHVPKCFYSDYYRMLQRLYMLDCTCDEVILPDASVGDYESCIKYWTDKDELYQISTDDLYSLLDSEPCIDKLIEYSEPLN